MQATGSGACGAMRLAASKSPQCETALNALEKSSFVSAHGTLAAAHFAVIVNGRTTAGRTPVKRYWSPRS